MSGELVELDGALPAVEGGSQFATFEVDGQLLGIDVLDVQDVLDHHEIAPVPLAKKEVAGLLNLRGRIVTAIDMREKLGIGPIEGDRERMSIVVEKGQELYSLIVDKIEDVMTLPIKKFEQNPPNLEPMWADLSSGVYRLEDRIMLVIDVNNLLNYDA